MRKYPSRFEMPRRHGKSTAWKRLIERHIMALRAGVSEGGELWKAFVWDRDKYAARKVLGLMIAQRVQDMATNDYAADVYHRSQQKWPK